MKSGNHLAFPSTQRCPPHPHHHPPVRSRVPPTNDPDRPKSTLRTAEEIVPRCSTFVATQDTQSENPPDALPPPAHSPPSPQISTLTHSPGLPIPLLLSLLSLPIPLLLLRALIVQPMIPDLLLAIARALLAGRIQQDQALHADLVEDLGADQEDGDEDGRLGVGRVLVADVVAAGGFCAGARQHRSCSLCWGFGSDLLLACSRFLCAALGENRVCV